MCEETDFVKAASRLSCALETNSLETLTAIDFQVFIDWRSIRSDTPPEIVQKASENLLSVIFSDHFGNDNRIVTATAYTSLIAYINRRPGPIFEHFIHLLSQDVGKNYHILLCHATLKLNNCYWIQECDVKEVLLEEIFKVVQRVCGEFKSSSVFAFKVFNSLLSKIHHLHQDGRGVSVERFSTMLDIVMSHWENPLGGVRQQNTLVLGYLLEFDKDIWDAVLPRSTECDMVMNNVRHQRLLELILTQLSWNMKSKYFMLTAVLQKSKRVSKVLKRYGEDFVAGLMFSLSVPHLVSAGTDLYRTILERISQRHWEDWFLDPVINTISASIISLEMENFYKYWVQPTLCKLPTVLKYLVGDTYPISLYSYISQHKLGRKEGFHCSKWESLDSTKVKCALECYSDEIRSQAFALVCVSARTSFLPSKEEFDLVQQFLRQNINSDNTAFRQNILNSFTSFVIRIRDSLLCIIKSKNFEIVSETQCFPFLDELHSFLLFNLGDKCNYQRKIASLEVYKIILTYFGKPVEIKDKAYTRKSNKEHLNLKEYEDNLSWVYPFELKPSQKTMLNCLLDEDNEVRLSAANILKSYFRAFDVNLEESQNLFRKGLSLCSGPIFYKAESGALMVQVLVTLTSNTSFSGFKDSICGGNNSFANLLLSSAEEQFQQLQGDLLRAASQGSFLYGTLQALRLVLTDPTSPEFMLLDEGQLERLILLLENCTDHFIAVLSSKSDPKSDYAPSFSEMGMAIAAAVESSSLKEEEISPTGTDQTLSELQLTPAQQLVLSCVWLNLKECTKLCSRLVSRPLSAADTARCVKLVVSVLRRCRHKGAIESAGVALNHITTHATSSGEPQLMALPTQLMEEFLQSLVSTTAGTVSRRSAGLSILVHRLITGDSRPKKPLLHLCVSKLLPIASNAEVTPEGPLVDLPQSQALHFLRTLVQESSLREQMAQYTLDISLVALTNLASPIWTIRNAALQLFGALVPKLVGQKPHQEEGIGNHLLEFKELYTHAQPLVEMMLSEISVAAKSHCTILHSKLMPLLTLVTNLTVGLQTVLKKDLLNIVDQFKEHFKRLFKSNIFSVRKLSAKAHSSFLTPAEVVPMIDQRARQVMDFLKGKESCIASENELHGYLLNVTYLVERFNQDKIGMEILLDDEEKMGDTLKSLSEAVLSGRHSFFVKSLIFDWKYPKPVLFEQTRPSLETTVERLGFPHFNNKQLPFVFEIFNDKEIHETLVRCLLGNPNYDTKLSCLKALRVMLRLKAEHLCKHGVQALLVTLRDFVFQSDRNAHYLLALILEMMLRLLERKESINANAVNNEPVLNTSQNNAYNLFCPEFLSLSQELFLSSSTSTSVLTFLLPVVCGFLSTENNFDSELVQQLASIIKERSDPHFNQDIRVHAAKSMAFLIQALQCDTIKETNSGELIWNACVNFLQDEVTEVRYEASRFVTLFVSKNDSTWNPFLSLEHLFKYSLVSQLIMPEQALNCLWELMHSGHGEINSNVGISNPFDHGVKSIYAEQTVISNLAFHCILELTSFCSYGVKLRVLEMCYAFYNNGRSSSKTVQYVNDIETSLRLDADQ